MIRYALICNCNHEYETWFGSSDDFDKQAERGLVECPLCGGVDVRKQVMAPAVARSSGGGKTTEKPDMAALAKTVREHISKTFTDVGAAFPEEARKVHHGESEAKSIYGTATREEADSLREEGVSFAPLPPGLSPDAAKKLN